MDFELDRGIAVRQISAGEGAEVTYAADLDAGWGIGGGLNGGYVLAVIGNALRATCSPVHPDPVTTSGYYLTPSRPGPALVHTRVLRRGGRLTTVAASLVQEEDGAEVERLSVLATYADLERSTDEVATTMVEPDFPAPEECFATVEAAEDFRRMGPLLDRLGTRLTPDSVAWTRGQPSGRGRIEGWFRFADDRPLDPIALLLVVDALPPASFDLGRPGWAPTLELTVHVRASPAPGWVKLSHRTRNVAGGYFEEDAEVWDARGRLVAQSRQLALMPRASIQ